MLLLDFLLLMMIIICVVYCWILNRRIYDLQNSRMEFARMIKELNSSISKAESNVNEMSQLSKLTNAEIKTAIDQAKEQMQQVFLGDEFGYDDEWEKFLLKNLQDIDLPLEAVINNKVSTIEDVANLKIGDTIIMNHSKEKDITLHSGAVPLFTGKIGKVDNKFAINLKKIIEK